MATLGVIAFVIVQLVALCVIPLGLPGTWLQVVAAAVVAWSLDRPLGGLLVLVALALAGEVVESLSGQWGTRRFGGSRRAAWGALIGGFAGLFVGLPIPIVGSLVTSFVGTFVGALVGETWDRGRLTSDVRIGVGALVGRAIGIGVKLGTAFVIAILSLPLAWGVGR